MVLLLEVDCLDINFGLGGITGYFNILARFQLTTLLSLPWACKLELVFAEYTNSTIQLCAPHKIHIVSSSLLAQLCYYFM